MLCLLCTDGGSLKRPYEPCPYDSRSHPVKSATVLAEPTLLSQPSLSTESQPQLVFHPIPDPTPVAVNAADIHIPTTGVVTVSGPGLVVKQEVRPVIGSTPPVLPAVTPSLAPLPLTYAAGVSALHNASGYVTSGVRLNPSVIQFLQQQQPAVQTGSITSTHLTQNNVGNILAPAPKPPVLTNDNINVQMLLNLLNGAGNKPREVGTVQWLPAPAHSSNTPPTCQPFIVQNLTTVAAMPQDLSNQLVFSLGASSSFAAPSVVSYGTMPAVVSSVLIATPAVTSPQLTHPLTDNDQVLNLTLHSSSQRMDTNVSDSFSGISQTASFSPVDTTAFVGPAPAEETAGFCGLTAVSIATSTYAEPMAVAAHFAADTDPPPLKTMICMTDAGTDPVLVQQHVTGLQQDNSLTDKLYVNAISAPPPAAVAQTQFAAVGTQQPAAAHNFANNVIVHMDITSSPHPPTKPVQTSPTELAHDINATGIIGGNLEPSSLFLTSDNNPMLTETSSQPPPQNTVDFASQSVLGMDISSAQLSELNVAAETAALNVPANDSAVNSMGSNLQQSLAELLDLQQQFTTVNVPVSPPVQPPAVLDSPLSRELAPVASESMQWLSSTAGRGQTSTADLPAESNVMLASGSVDTLNLMTAAEVLSNVEYGQETNHDIFYSAQPPTSYAVVIGSAGTSQETSATSWNQQAAQSSYTPDVEIKQEKLSSTGDVVMDLLSSMTTATGRQADTQLYTQQTAGNVASDFFHNSNVAVAAAAAPVTTSSVLTVPAGNEASQSVLYVVNQLAVDRSGTAQEPGTQPIAYHIVAANPLPNCSPSQDISIVQYATSQQIQPVAGSDVHSPTSSGFRVLTADALSPSSTDPSPGGLQFQLSQPISFAGKLHQVCHVCVVIADRLLISTTAHLTFSSVHFSLR